jgi:hypothetical protein
MRPFKDRNQHSDHFLSVINNPDRAIDATDGVNKDLYQITMAAVMREVFSLAVLVYGISTFLVAKRSQLGESCQK